MKDKHRNLLILFAIMCVIWYTTNIAIIAIIIKNVITNMIYPDIQEIEYDIIKGKRIVVTLTTSPTRINKIEKMIDSIMNQNVKPDRIYINLPHVFKRDNTRFGILPEFIKNNPIIYINRTEDIGPSTKIIPTLEHEKDPETMIISVDDDIYYKKNFIAGLVYYGDKYPDSVITGTTFIQNNEENVKEYKELPYWSKIYYAQFLEGYSGVLYKPKFFKNFNKQRHLLELPRNCQMGDDLILSNYILSQNIPIISIENRSSTTELEYGLEDDALHKNKEETRKENYGNINNYKKCVEWLRRNNKLYIRNIKKSTIDEKLLIE